MKARAPLHRLPFWLQRHVLHFESEIELAVAAFAATLPPGSRVLDAGAGECQYAGHFQATRYTALDLGIGDQTWEYGKLHAIGDLLSLPFPDGTFAAALNIVTLEHVTDPARVIEELYRCLQPGGRLLLVTPLEWEEHQQPHDFFRYTRYGLEHLTQRAGFVEVQVHAVGGFFRLLSRRLMNSVQFFPGWLAILPLLAFGLPALTLPLLDGLDKRCNFTLGHICWARKP